MATKKTTTSKLKSTNAEVTEAVETEDEISAEIEDTADESADTKKTANGGENKSGVIFTEKTNDNNKVKQATVTVVLNRDHRCNIGGVWYDFVKGKPVDVPANVKSILKKAGFLSAV